MKGSGREWTGLSDAQIQRGLPSVCVVTGQPADAYVKRAMATKMTGGDAALSAVSAILAPVTGFIGVFSHGRSLRIPVTRTVRRYAPFKAIGVPLLWIIAFIGFMSIVSPLMDGISAKSIPLMLFGIGILAGCLLGVATLRRAAVRIRTPKAGGLEILAHRAFLEALGEPSP